MKIGDQRITCTIYKEAHRAGLISKTTSALLGAFERGEISENGLAHLLGLWVLDSRQGMVDEEYVL